MFEMPEVTVAQVVSLLDRGRGEHYYVGVDATNVTVQRFILADTEQLHRKISEMSERIRQLEDVVALFQAGISNERHPLLRDELLTIKFGPEVRRTVDEENTREKLSQSIDALGTLTIGDHGETKYFGRSGGSEVSHSHMH